MRNRVTFCNNPDHYDDNLTVEQLREERVGIYRGKSTEWLRDKCIRNGFTPRLDWDKKTLAIAAAEADDGIMTVCRPDSGTESESEPECGYRRIEDRKSDKKRRHKKKDHKRKRAAESDEEEDARPLAIMRASDAPKHFINARGGGTSVRNEYGGAVTIQYNIPSDRRDDFERDLRKGKHDGKLAGALFGRGEQAAQGLAGLQAALGGVGMQRRLK